MEHVMIYKRIESLEYNEFFRSVEGNLNRC